MVFAALDYPDRYEDKHAEIVTFLSARFPRVESGLQCDSWIWVYIQDDKIEIDTFYSTKHWIKSSRPGPHVDAVIQALRGAFTVLTYPTPELEPHE
jgi:hypothetical protein